MVVGGRGGALASGWKGREGNGQFVVGEPVLAAPCVGTEGRRVRKVGTEVGTGGEMPWRNILYKRRSCDVKAGWDKMYYYVFIFNLEHFY